jgi:hypothetical protein
MVDSGATPIGMSKEGWKKLDRKDEEKNLIVSLRFNITKCIRGSYNQGIVG